MCNAKEEQGLIAAGSDQANAISNNASIREKSLMTPEEIERRINAFELALRNDGYEIRIDASKHQAPWHKRLWRRLTALIK